VTCCPSCVPMMKITFLTFLFLTVLFARADEDSTSSASCDNASSTDNYNLHWHVSGIFVVLGASGLGAFGTMLLGDRVHKPMAAKIVQVLKMFGIGVVAATAWIHLLPDAFEQFSNHCLSGLWASYGVNWIGVFALLSTFGLQLLELFMGMHTGSDGEAHPHTHLRESMRFTEVEDSKGEANSAFLRNEETGESIPIKSNSIRSSPAPTAKPSARNSPGLQPRKSTLPKNPVLDQQEGRRQDSELDDSSRSGSINDSPGQSTYRTVEISPKKKGSRVRRLMMIIVLESGILIHSLVIGVTLGVAEDDVFTPLVAAISFHQLFEGMALGALIGTSKASSLRKLFMCLLYPLTTPIGIAIGIAVRRSYNENDQGLILYQGILDSLSVGILMYNSYCNLLGQEINQNKKFRNFEPRFKAANFISLYLGAAAMAIVGIWA
jgi:zinc transporter 1/2/3